MTDPLLDLIARADALIGRLESVLPQATASAPDWQASVAFRYRRRGGGVGRIEPVRQVANIRLEALVEVGPQKERLLRNTEQFVAGRGANNVLLTGARGTGKSSLVKACLNEYSGRGLRLIEVDKADLIDLPDIVDLIAARPERFIVFCDDLSFDEGEPGYKALKSILDGSVSQATDNLLIYATSNRRHLLPEYMQENRSYQHLENGEVHPGEVIEEKISLSERFGLWISFYPFSQDEYLGIVAQWLRHFGVDEGRIAAARQESLVWALERGSRSGRVAYQFAKDLSGRWAGSSQGRPEGEFRSAQHEGGPVSSPAAAAERMPVDVAVGVLIDDEGRFLLTSRPAGKVYAGYWEFPGGKLEAGESVAAALRRELQEELGIAVDGAEPWRVEIVDYPHARVRLHFCKVRRWSGEFEMRERQSMAWQTLPVAVAPVLPGTLPVLDWFAAERGFVGSTTREDR